MIQEVGFEYEITNYCKEKKKMLEYTRKDVISWKHKTMKH